MSSFRDIAVVFLYAILVPHIISTITDFVITQQHINDATIHTLIVRHLGDWSASVAYVPNDMVVSNNTSYLCNAPNTNVTPGTNETAWGLIASRGLTGQGFHWLGNWTSETNYTAYDVVSSDGSFYVCIADNVNVVPPNATYWEIGAAKGDAGPTGNSYGGTATDSRTLASSGAFTFTLAPATSGIWAYVLGTRIRASFNSTCYMEGIVTSFDSVTNVLTFTSDLVVGSGTFTSWTFSVAGNTGTTGATGPAGINKVHVLREEYSSGTNGGAAVGAIFAKRPLNVEQSSPNAGSILNTVDHTFTLPAGTYKFNAWSTAYNATVSYRSQLEVGTIVGGHLLNGGSIVGAAGQVTHPVLMGLLNLTVSTQLDLRMSITAFGSTTDLGNPANLGYPEIYSFLEITVLA